MIKNIKFSVLVCLSLFFLACSSNTNVEKSQKPNVSLINNYWKVISLYGEKVKISRKEAHIRFEEAGSTNGSLGCNNFFGAYNIDKENITFKNVASTRMMCQNMKTEDSFSKVFQDTRKYKIKGETLIFFDGTNKEIAKFKVVYF